MAEQEEEYLWYDPKERYQVVESEHIVLQKTIWVIYDMVDSSPYNWYNTEEEAYNNCFVLNSIENALQ
jgi:hypothetical protein